ncbi:MAG: response regulator transcription factor [Erysipelotrichaceae bacterium]|nr:response regulator transcription factor [Erysipelotrichaceae bacterium]
MITVGIFGINDDQNKIVSRMIKKYFKDKETLKIDFSSDSNKFLDTIEKNGAFDIVVIDLDYSRINGLNIASEVSKRNENSYIILLSKSKQDAYEGIKIGVIDYILKPIIDEEFVTSIEKAYKLIISENVKYLKYKTSDGYKRININNIIYVEAEKHYQHIYLKNNKKVTIRSTIKKLEEELSSLTNQFVKTHSSFLVNIDFIKEINKYIIILTNTNIVPISKNLKSGVKAKINQYYSKN